MIEKNVNGYLFNHKKSQYLEMYIFNNLSHTINDVEKIAKDNGLKVFKKVNEQVYLCRINIYYDDYEKIKSLYKTLNDDLKIKNIQYYETIKIIKTVLKYAFL